MPNAFQSQTSAMDHLSCEVDLLQFDPKMISESVCTVFWLWATHSLKHVIFLKKQSVIQYLDAVTAYILATIDDLYANMLLAY